jgi:hypothetical protein
MIRSALTFIAACAALAGCTIARETSPQRSATEQLLISTAADDAAGRIALPLAAGTVVFVDATNIEGADAKYAVAAVREQLLRQGAKIAVERPKAEVIVDFRAGALSIDEETFLVGIPSFDIPVPLAGPLSTPEFALFKRGEKRGVAKFVAVAYRTDSGDFVGTSEAQYGFSYKREWKLLFVIAWGRDNLLPDEHRPSRFQMQPPLPP